MNIKSVLRRILRLVFRLMNSRPKSRFILRLLLRPLGIALSSIFEVERAEWAFYVRYLRPGMIVFDVGAHVGELSSLFSRFCGQQGQVHAFEPSSASFERLKAICKFPNRENITPNYLALADKEGMVKLNVYSDEHSVWNGLSDRPTHIFGSPVGTERIWATTIDTYCAQNGISQIDLLKIDVEGAEYQVLLGAKRVLEEQRIRCCVFEFSPETLNMVNSPDEIEAYLKQFGYRIQNVVKGEPIFPGGQLGFRILNMLRVHQNVPRATRDKKAQFAGHIAMPKNNRIRSTVIMIKRSIKHLLKTMRYQVSRISPEQPGQREASEITVEETNNATLVQRITNTLEQSYIVKVHVGCGPRVLKGWINIDLSYVPYHDYMQYYTDKFYPESIRGDQSDFYAIDVTKNPLPFPDNSVDVIFHEDFLEHLSQRDQVLLLAETLRILKKGGVHRVNTPDLLASMRDHSDFSRGPIGVYAEEWNKHEHLNVLTPNLLEELALMVGYSKVVFTGRDQSTSKLIPLEYRPDPNDRPEDGNIFADLIK